MRQPLLGTTGRSPGWETCDSAESAGISNREDRRFYELEAANENCSLRELKRQFDSGLYERLALSRDKAGLKALSEKGKMVEKHTDVVKDPYFKPTENKNIKEVPGNPDKSL